MDTLNLDTHEHISIEAPSIVCPYCGTTMVPRFLGTSYKSNEELYVLVRCQVPKCKKVFLITYNILTRIYNTRQELAISEYNFEKEIEEVSPSFVNIYN